MNKTIGDYYWFVDSDDFVRENSLAKLKSICEQKKCDILSFRLFYFDDSESEMLKKRLNAEETISSNSIIRAQQSMFISRELIGSQRWHPGVEVGEDSLFLRELMMKNPYVFEIDDTVYFYRQHSSSSIHSGGSSTRRMISHVNGALIAKELYDSPGGHCEANANLLRMFVIYACQKKQLQKTTFIPIEPIFSERFMVFFAPIQEVESVNYYLEGTIE